MINIGIFDNNENNCHFIYDAIISSKTHLHTSIKIYNSGTSFLWAICEHQPFDILFLHLHPISSDKEDIDFIINKILSYLPNVSIIFMSNDLEDSFTAFKYHAFEFLLLPCNTNIVQKKFLHFVSHFDDSQCISVHKKGHIINVPIHDITYINSCGRKLIIHRNNVEDLCVYDNIDSVEQKLCDSDFLFCRVHNSYIVNLEKVKIYSRSSLELTDGIIINISRKYINNTRFLYLQKHLSSGINIGAYSNVSDLRNNQNIT